LEVILGQPPVVQIMPVMVVVVKAAQE